MIDCCNAILGDLGIRDRELCVDSAYGGHRLNWLFPSTGQSDIGRRGTLGNVYDELEAIYDVLYEVRKVARD